MLRDDDQRILPVGVQEGGVQEGGRTNEPHKLREGGKKGKKFTLAVVLVRLEFPTTNWLSNLSP